MSESITIDAPKTWDYCQIEFRIDDGDDSNRDLGNKLEWVQFFAPASCPNGDYLAGKSGRFPVDEGVDSAEFEPSADNLRHQNVLNIFLNSLQNDAWEVIPPVEYPDAPWYARKLRRPTRPVVIPVVKKSHKLLITVSVLVLAILSAVVIRNWTRPFPNGIRDYKELELTEVEGEPYRIGKMLIVDPLPVSLLSERSGRPDPLHELLPDDIRADGYDEVETLIWLGCRSRVRDAWTSRDCKVTVIDYEAGIKFVPVDFPGERFASPVEPKLRILLRDDEAIMDYILSLPEKQ